MECKTNIFFDKIHKRSRGQRCTNLSLGKDCWDNDVENKRPFESSHYALNVSIIKPKNHLREQSNLPSLNELIHDTEENNSEEHLFPKIKTVQSTRICKKAAVK